MAHFLKNCKKVKIEVTGTEKHRFWLIYLKTFHKSTFLGPVTSINFFAVFSKMHQGHAGRHLQVDWCVDDLGQKLTGIQGEAPQG